MNRYSSLWLSPWGEHGGGSFHMTRIKLCTDAVNNLFALSADPPPLSIPFFPKRGKNVHLCLSISNAHGLQCSISLVYFDSFQAVAWLLCSLLSAERMGEDKGSSPKDASCHKTLSKKEFAGGEEEEKERNPPLTCARAQIFLPLPTQFSRGKRNHLTWKLSFHLWVCWGITLGKLRGN